MRQREGERQSQMVDLLSDLHLSEEETDAIYAYLSGELSGEEEETMLEKLQYRDVSTVRDQVVMKLGKMFQDLKKRGRTEEAARLFAVMFQISQASCSQFIPFILYDGNQIEELSPSAPEKLIVVMVQNLMKYIKIRTERLDYILKLAGRKPEVIKKALAYQKGSSVNERMILYSLYFFLKYPNISIPEAEKGGKGLLAGFTKLFGSNRGEESLLENSDQELMVEYETFLNGTLESLFLRKMASEDLQRVRSCVESGRDVPLTEEDRLMIGRHEVDENRLFFMAGCVFLNAALSSRLHQLVRICIAAKTNAALSAMSVLDLRKDLSQRGGDFDQRFQIAPEQLIQWAQQNENQTILRAQYTRNKEVYLACFSLADLESGVRYGAIIQEQDQSLFQTLTASRAPVVRESIIQKLLNGGTFVASDSNEKLKQYLLGNERLNSSYRYKTDTVIRTYAGGLESRLLETYREIYGRDEFYRKCQVYMAAIGAPYFFSAWIRKHKDNYQEFINQLLDDFNEEGLGVADQMICLIDICNQTIYMEEEKKAFMQAMIPRFEAYLDSRREALTTAWKESDAVGRYFGILVMGQRPEAMKDEIFSYSQDNSKQVREALVSLLWKHPEWEGDVLGFLKSKKAAERELAILVLKQWNMPSHRKVMEQALETEKSSKIKQMMETALNIESGEAASGEVSQADLVTQLHKGGKKRSLAWVYETPCSVVHMKNGKEAEENYLQALLLCYVSMSIPGISKNAAYLAEELVPGELALYVNELFDKWIEGGAEAKKRWVLYASSIHGGGEIIQKMKARITEWPLHARGAIAADAVRALALNPMPSALLTVDGISRKFKYRQVKTAAGEALNFAAEELGITREELEDKIVPDLGFGQDMERIFDYGSRTFTVSITPALEVEVYDENKKRLKTMPSPGKRDDAELAVPAYEAFKEMKKQMKVAVSNQKLRMEQALSVKRMWPVESWRNLFVTNPLMHQFAIGLIWGLYEEQKLTQMFRYMEDGSFNTQEEEELELPEQGLIGLIHPIELSKEAVAAWQEQLEDYEISQPVEQLKRPIYPVTEEEKGMKQLERFGGVLVSSLSLMGKLQSMGWYHAMAEDAGMFYSYYREDVAAGIRVELSFSGSFIAVENEDITLFEVVFYPAGDTGTRYRNEKERKEQAYALGEVPEQYFSEIVYQLTRATASSKERNEQWKMDAR